MGNTFSYRFTGLAPDVRHYFAATAYDTAGNESSFSEEVSVFLEPQDTIWAAPRFKLLTDTLGLTKEALMATPPLADTLDVDGELWIAVWKNAQAVADDGWDIEGADSVSYRFKAAAEPDSSYQYYVQHQRPEEFWPIVFRGGMLHEISVAAHREGRDAQFALPAYFRSGKDFTLLQLTK